MGRVVGNVILRVVMERLRDLDVSGQNLLHEQLFSPYKYSSIASK